MGDSPFKIPFLGHVQNQGLDIQVNQAGKLEDGNQHLFRLVVVDGLRDFQQGLELQFFSLVKVAV